MINVGNRHAAIKNSAHETISKRYVAQDSSSLSLTLDRSNSAAAISQAASGSATPTINIRIENWIARVKCIATSGVWLLFAAIKIKHPKRPIALSKIRAVVNLCPIRLLLASQARASPEPSPVPPARGFSFQIVALSALPTVGDAAIDTACDTTMAYCEMGRPAKEDAIAPSVHSI